MSNKVELRARLDFWQAALKKLRTAYLALVDGGVKSYMIDDRQLTRFDLPALQKQIEEAEAKVDELENLLNEFSMASAPAGPLVCSREIGNWVIARKGFTMGGPAGVC